MVPPLPAERHRRIDAASMLITDEALDPDACSALIEIGVEVLVATDPVSVRLAGADA